MSWITIIWSMNAAACLTLAAINLLIWQAQRDAWERIPFSIAAVATAAMAFLELSMLRAETLGQYATALLWFHVAAWWIVVALVLFVRLSLRAGRPWLAWTVCTLRTFALLLNFLVGQNMTYHEITHLRHIPFLADSFVAPSGVPNPWMLVPQLSNVIFIAFATDAMVTIWRRGDRREALIEMGSIVFFGVIASLHGALLSWQLIDWPWMTSFFFMAIVATMSYEMSRDVLRAVQLSDDLRESEDRMALAAEAAGFGFWMWRSGHDRVWGSEKWHQLFGFPADANISDEEVTQRIHPDDRKVVGRERQRALENQGSYAVQYRVMSADGTPRWIASLGRMYPAKNGKPARMLGVAVDITERKEAEVELARQRDRLTNLSRATMLGELSGALAHELNQPLTAILSNAQAAWRFLMHDPPDLTEVRDIIADIVAEDKRAGEIIHRLRLLFKTGAVQRHPLNLKEMIEEVLTLVRSDLVNRGVDVQTELALNLPMVHGDRVELQQVLLNLVMNACDAMAGATPHNRQLTIRTDVAGRDYVHISVSDRGMGITPEVLEQVFDAFYTSKAHGLGLGLAVCRRIITAHRGKVWATNNPARGATFHFTLPAGEEVGTRDEGRSATVSQRSPDERGLTQKVGR